MAEKKKAEKKSVETMLSRLEDIVRLLEKGELPLEESLSLYEEGCGLIRDCMTSLDKAEQTVLMWQKKVDGSYAEMPFSAGEGSHGMAE